MPAEHLLMIPRLFVIANRLHRANRPTYFGRVCLALAAAAGLIGLGLAVGFAAATCGPDCDHP